MRAAVLQILGAALLVLAAMLWQGLVLGLFAGALACLAFGIWDELS